MHQRFCFQQAQLSLAATAGGANLQTLFSNNLNSLLAYATASTLGGLRGSVVRRAGGAPLEGAQVTVNGSTTVTRSGRQGTFYRPLAPGPYVVRVALGALVQSFQVQVPATGAGVALVVRL